uniref:Uncharacterized protein n=1 Tax=Candidatus Methanophaga sp. ANME-1 ERB7 TaxID=2759913 RepID=A0A7G9Z2C1_9EURY|nr:hypothetical protein JEICAKEA_00015 [Methanosarcinales archaeon ANME-1 ERB7]
MEEGILEEEGGNCKFITDGYGDKNKNKRRKIESGKRIN